jgi:Asp-tRNA(Asn)/Glu-tRNA(Gln) amidotransferase A subunit family amidase
MKSLGAQVVDIAIPDLAELTRDMALGGAEQRVGLNRYFASLGPKAPFKDLTAFIAAGGFHAAIADQLRAADANLRGMSAPEYAAAFVRRDRLRQAVLAVMARERLDAIVYPHQRRLVAKVGDEQLERNGVLSNGTGFPAITLPAGFSAPDENAPLGVPVGVELLGREWSEGRLISLSYAFEQGTRLRRPPASTPPLEARTRAPDPAGHWAGGRTGGASQPLRAGNDRQPVVIRSASLYDRGRS